MIKRASLLIVCFMLLFTSCKKHELSQTIKTQFNDEINIHAYLSGNLHGKYLCCEITATNVDGYVYLCNRELLQIPDNISNSLQPVTMYKDVRIYELYNELIVIQGREIENFSIDYNINDFLSEAQYNGVKVDVVYSGISALCYTKKFEFISQFLPILEHIKQDDSICEFIHRWAMNDFTNDELIINQDYTREEISNWCNKYLENTRATQGDGSGVLTQSLN